MKITGNIEKLLEAAQKNTWERRLTVEEVQNTAQELIEYLHGKGIAYADMTGIKATLDPCIPYSTQIDIEFTGSTCKITGVFRGRAQAKLMDITLTNTAKAALIAAIEVGAAV